MPRSRSASYYHKRLAAGSPDGRDLIGSKITLGSAIITARINRSRSFQGPV